MSEHDLFPEQLIYHQASQQLEIHFSNGETFMLPSEYLRVHSPSASVRGHGVGQEVLQTGKQHVAILNIEMVGHYAAKLTFSDGHDSGLYTWHYLYELGKHQAQYWQRYLEKLEEAGASREIDLSLTSPNVRRSCGKSH